MYGMGKSGGLPQAFFTAVHPTSGIPYRNVLLIGAASLTGSFVLSYQSGAELLNFGAFIGFMGVNLSCFLRYGIREKQGLLSLLLPALGFLVCAYLWWNLSTIAKLWGTGWLAIGLLWHFGRTRIKAGTDS